MKKITLIALCTVAVAALAACGGSDYSNSTPPATVSVPPSASESVGGFIAYLKELVASAADMLEPVDTSMVTAPTDDTTEPVVVD